MGERMYIPERIAPGLLFSSECTSQLSIAEIVKWPASFSAMFSQLHSVTNKKHEEKDLCNESIQPQWKTRTIPVKRR